MPGIELKLTDWPNSSGGTTTETTSAIPVDIASAAGVLTYLNAKAGYRNADGEIIPADQADETCTQRTLEDVLTTMLVSLCGAYIRDAKAYAATITEPNLPAPVEADATTTRVGA